MRVEERKICIYIHTERMHIPPPAAVKGIELFEMLEGIGLGANLPHAAAFA